MNLIISNSNPRPIYSQIESQIKAMILNGRLKEGDALPSMRNLAKDLRISMITTKRAYEAEHAKLRGVSAGELQDIILRIYKGE